MYLIFRKQISLIGKLGSRGSERRNKARGIDARSRTERDERSLKIKFGDIDDTGRLGGDRDSTIERGRG